MKIMTILGTRPEIIRLSLTIPLLDRMCNHLLVHTGQNYQNELSDDFFRELGIRKPDVNLGVRATHFGEQIGQIMSRSAEVMEHEKPDRILILGDTNSGLTAINAARQGIPVYHMEAGNRCYDDRVPEEINRRIIDHCSTVLMPYTHRSKENLLREGIERQRVFVIGNPIFEVIEHYREHIEKSGVLEQLGVEPRRYFVATLHRAENVDDMNRLQHLLDGLDAVQEKYGQPVAVSLHPHTEDRMKTAGFDKNHYKIRFLKPLGFFEFVALEKNARCVITDSGTVQEECCIFHVPNVTIRDTTERPETIECGSNVLTGIERESILRCVNVALSTPQQWIPPTGYVEPHSSTAVVKITLGYLPPLRLRM